jgi:DNA mismatch repair protein MutS
MKIMERGTQQMKTELNTKVNALARLVKDGATFDGLSIAWAITEYLHNTVGAKTVFATHYHQLTQLEGPLPGVKNCNIAVKEEGGTITFLRTVVPGATDKSYGVHVARLAGVPRSVITRARQLMGQLAVHVGKAGKAKAAAVAITPQVGMFDPVDQQALTQLRALDMNRMSPMQAWEALRTLQGLLGEKKQ